MRGKICATIFARDNKELTESAEKAFSLGAELVEFRLDSLKKIDHSTLKCLLPYSERCIVTIRSKNQGGSFTGSDKDRLELLRSLLTIRPFYIDIELDTVKKNPYYVEMIKHSPTRMIVSWHNFKSTPNLDKLVKIYKKARHFGDIIKIVTLANSLEDNATILSLYGKVKYRQNLIAFCMGEKGIISRILCLFHGSPISYFSLDNEVVPGQIPIAIARGVIQNAH